MDYKTLFEKTPPTKLFAIAAIPGVIGMLASALYQIIDGAFVGHILGAEAFAALNLVMPLVIINFAVADLIGVGSAVPIAIKLGEKDIKTASNIFTSACLLIVGSGFIFGALLFIFAEDFVRMLGADGQLLTMSTQYLRVYAACSPITTIVFAMDNYLRICGKIRFSMILNILMSVASAVFEFLFLYVFRFGIWGAALATCLGMFLCAVLAFIPFIRGSLQLRFGRPRLTKKVIASIFTNGAPSFLNNVAGRITSIIMNIMLMRLGGPTAISAYGILMYADGFVQPILYGLCDSLQPAVGYNWGARNYNRVKAIEKRCFTVSGVLSILMFFIMFFAPTTVTAIFVKPEETGLITMSIQALSLFAFAYLTRWLAFATQSFMSAVGKAMYAAVISVSTAFVFPLILIVTLRFLELDGLWLNYPLTSLLSALLAFFILLRFGKTFPKSSLKSDKARAMESE
ncbi:MAG TPA: polysaccharide biosynthesis C-terminal domain-containing protein [Candidatus Pelethocola excrementipullorum]|nr:polysaccharide biosynthesis C-terminal domain-containing protein [Candidatus Pelethocola excrementipullorum]